MFLSNIHGMPGVARVFVIPKMRKYPHRIMLADEEGLLDDFPREDGKLTVFKLNELGIIEEFRFWEPKAGDSGPFDFQASLPESSGRDILVPAE